MSEKRRRVSLLGTADDHAEAEIWRARLREGGIASIERGHREGGSVERRPTFAGVDVYVPAALLKPARELLREAIGVGKLPDDEMAFPWMWLAVVLASIAVLLTVLVGVLVATV